MSKKMLIIWSLIWEVLGILAALSILKNMTVGISTINLILMAGLTLYCFDNGTRGFLRVFKRGEMKENGGDEEAGCGGG